MKENKRILTIVIAIMFALSITGCSKQQPTTSNTSGTATLAQNKDPNVAGFEKYDPPIEITTWRVVTPSYKFINEGESIDNNVWYKEYQEKLGIKVKNIWVVNAEQGTEKINVSIASGDLPDIMPANGIQFKQMVEADLLMDMKPYYEQYGSDILGDVLNKEYGNAINAVTINGKMQCLPKPTPSQDALRMIWVRTDWLNNLGLQPPKNMQDVFKIIEAFAKQDPDRNGKNDTYGMAINQNIIDGNFGNLLGFFQGYHAYPREWIEKDGKLVYGTIQPEMKGAILKLQEMMKSGWLDKEFGVKNPEQMLKDVSAGRTGVVYGQWATGTPGNLQESRNANHNADWISLPLPSIDDQPAKTIGAFPVGQYNCINKNAKYPEAAVKMLNQYVENRFGKTANPGKFYNDNGHEVFMFAVLESVPPMKNLNGFKSLQDALSKNDSSKLNAEFINYWTELKKFEGGDDKTWYRKATFDPKVGSYGVVKYYVENGLEMQTAYYGTTTPTQSQKGQTLQKLESEVLTRILLGASIDEFDKFVADWKKLGGDDWTKEVNDWYAAQPK